MNYTYQRLSSVPSHPEEVDVPTAHCTIDGRHVDTELGQGGGAELWGIEGAVWEYPPSSRKVGQGTIQVLE